MRKILVLILIFVLLFTACDSGEVNSSSSSVDNEQQKLTDTDEYKKDENVITLSMRTTTTLNPLLNKDESVDSILRLMFKPLIGIDSNSKPEGVIAEGWYYTQEGMALTVNIKDDAKWHDGSDITADDVVYSINTIINSDEETVYKECVRRISRVYAQNRKTVNINFTEAFSGNIYSLNFPIIPRNYYRDDENLTPVGSGAYKFSDFTPAKELVLEACENSFSAEPSIKKIVVKMNTESDTDIYSFSQRITDCVVVGESDMGKYDFKGAEKYSFNSNYYEFIGFNFKNEILKNKNIRKAIACSVPLDNIIDSVYLSNAVKTTSPVNPSSFLYNKNIPYIEYDLNQAKYYVSVSGYKYDNDGNAFKQTDDAKEYIYLKILVNNESKERYQTALKLANELKTVGIKTDIDAVDFETYMQKLEQGDFDLFVGGWRLPIYPYFGFMFSSSSDMNYIYYEDTTMDELLNEAYNAVNENDIINAYNELEKYTAEELPYISLLFRKSALFVNNGINGNFDPVPYDYYRGIESWSVNV